MSLSHPPSPALPPEPLTQQVQRLLLAQHLKPAQIPPGGDERGCFTPVLTPCGPHTHQEDEAVQEQGVEEGHGPGGLVGQDEPPLQEGRMENPILTWVTGNQLCSNRPGEILARAGSLSLPDPTQTCSGVVFATHLWQVMLLPSGCTSADALSPNLPKPRWIQGCQVRSFPALKTLLGVYSESL